MATKEELLERLTRAQEYWSQDGDPRSDLSLLLSLSEVLEGVIRLLPDTRTPAAP